MLLHCLHSHLASPLADTALLIRLKKLVVFSYIGFEILKILNVADAVFGKLLRVEVEDRRFFVDSAKHRFLADIVALLLPAALRGGLTLAIPGLQLLDLCLLRLLCVVGHESGGRDGPPVVACLLHYVLTAVLVLPHLGLDFFQVLDVLLDVVFLLN